MRIPVEKRSGLTLLELLVVVGIIGVLTAIATVAVIPWIGGQKSRNTRALLAKLDGTLKEQYSEAMKKARSTSIPGGVMQMAGQNEALARSIWIKLQMKAEFPMSYAEALDPSGSTANPPGRFVNANELPAKPAFVKALAGKQAKDPLSESAACLLIALQQTRGGMKVDVETVLGPSAMKDTDGDGVVEIVDGFDKPVVFFRWGTGHPALDAQGKGGATERDTEDQDHALMSSTMSADAVAEFERFCHPIRSAGNPVSRYTRPTIVSAGKDMKLGLDALMTPLGAEEKDNIYSFNQK